MELKLGSISGYNEIDCEDCSKGQIVVNIKEAGLPKPMKRGWISNECCDNPDCPSNKEIK